MVAVEGIGSHLTVTQHSFLVDLFVYSVGSYGNNNFIFINRAVCPSVNQSYMSIMLCLVTCSVSLRLSVKWCFQHQCRTVALLIQDSRLRILLTVRLLLFNDAATSSICTALNCRTITILDIIHRTVFYLKNTTVRKLDSVSVFRWFLLSCAQSTRSIPPMDRWSFDCAQLSRNTCIRKQNPVFEPSCF
jgi:hypothetical protein